MLISAFESALRIDRQAATFSRSGTTRIVSVVSGKGGVGKTFVSTSLAVLAARTGMRVLLIDGDLTLANVDVALGLKAKFHIGDVVHGRATLAEAVVPGPDGLFILPGAPSPDRALELSAAEQRAFLEVVRALTPAYDLVVIDCGAGIGEGVLFFGRAAQECIVVVTPEPTSMVDALATIKALVRRAGVERVSVLVNQASERMGREIFRRLVDTVAALPVLLRYVGSVPLDFEVREALLDRRLLLTSRPACTASHALIAVGRSWLATNEAASHSARAEATGVP
ncbi:MAG TPA: P-loop NTPase [Myxococcota bacterium]